MQVTFLFLGGAYIWVAVYLEIACARSLTLIQFHSRAHVQTSNSAQILFVLQASDLSVDIAAAQDMSTDIRHGTCQD